MSDKKVLIPLEEYDRLRQCESDLKALEKSVADGEVARGHYVRKEVRIATLPLSLQQEAELAKSLAFEIMSDDEVLSEARQELDRMKAVAAKLVSDLKQYADAVREMESRTLWQRIANRPSGLPHYE